jgi:antitoxin HigA-1
MTTNPLLKGLKPTHPGELLRTVVLPALGKSKSEIADLLGISRQQLYDILGEKKPVTIETALRLGKLFGNGPEIWLNMQQAYDLAGKERTMAKVLKKIPTLQAATAG